MAEKSAPDAEDHSNEEFAAGFEGNDAAAQTADKPEDTKQAETDTKPDDKADPAPQEPEKAEAKPEHVSITKEQLERFEAAASKTADFQKQFDKAFGSIGNMQQLLTRLQASTPEGEAIKLPDDVVDELEKDFPELAVHVRSALEKAFKSGVRGTGTEPATDKDAISKAIQEDRMKREVEALEDAYPDWKEIVGAVTDGKFDPKHPFRSWLATQPESYQQKINATTNAAVIERAITRFKTHEAEEKAKAEKKPETKPNPQAAARKLALREAVQPRGSGQEPGTRSTPDDEFEKGFATG